MSITQIFAVALSGLLFITSLPIAVADQGSQAQTAPTPVISHSPEQLQQLVAPIALYPDELVAEVLAAATFPEQVVEADRWLQDHQDLQGQQVAKEVDKLPWDSSVKALTEFPSVLANMDKNLSWTSSLGDAYVNQQQEVMAAVQTMRDRAEQSGNLKSNSQENVTKQGDTIVVEPATPDVVYVPTYDPWLVYGAPIVAWPDWYWYPGLYVATPGITFGLGFGIGFFGGFGWGWHHWGLDWGHRTVLIDHTRYVSRSTTFINRSRVFDRGGSINRGAFDHAHNGFTGGAHGFVPNRPAEGMHSGAFSEFNHGAVTRGYSSGGRASFGEAHGGGFHGGGRR